MKGAVQVPAQAGEKFASLLAIVSVDSSHKVRCSHPGCKRTVYREIHVVRDEGQLLVLGSTCFAKRYGGLKALGQANYGAGSGRVLTEEERRMLEQNTEALLAHFEAQAAQARLEAQMRLQRLREAQQKALAPLKAPAPSIAPHAALRGPYSPPSGGRWPWPWMKPGTSVAAFKLRDGSGWVRVEHRDGRQFIAPWPSFEGWDEAMPALVGRADLEVGAYEVQGGRGGVPPVLEYLRTQAEYGERGEKRTGLWSDVVALLRSGAGQRSGPL